MTDTPRTPRFAFVKIVVGSLAAMEDFYSRTFAMQRTGTFATADIEEGSLAGSGGMSLVLYYRKAGPPPALGTAHGPIGFYVDDVDAACAHALECGAASARLPANYGPTIRAAFVFDPEGREIELIRRS